MCIPDFAPSHFEIFLLLPPYFLFVPYIHPFIDVSPTAILALASDPLPHSSQALVFQPLLKSPFETWKQAKFRLLRASRASPPGHRGRCPSFCQHKMILLSNFGMRGRGGPKRHSLGGACPKGWVGGRWGRRGGGDGKGGTDLTLPGLLLCNIREGGGSLSQCPAGLERSYSQSGVPIPIAELSGSQSQGILEIPKESV